MAASTTATSSPYADFSPAVSADGRYVSSPQIALDQIKSAHEADGSNQIQITNIEGG